MDFIEQVQQVYTGFLDLNPTSIFVVSLFGLIFTLSFVIMFRERILESYGKSAYMWFLFLILLNILNLFFITWYYRKKYNTVVGKKGPAGMRGKIGKTGDNVTCGTCKSNEEIGIQYSDNYFKIGKINKTTNVLGSITVWRASGMLGLAVLGDTIFTQDSANKNRTYLAGYGSKPPADFKKLIDISDGTSRLIIWEPVPPPGFSFVGHCVTVGTKKPNPVNFACLPTGCLIPTNNLLYISSFPAVDIIPSISGNRNLKFCSFWRTPLNHFYCKISDNTYSTNSLYYNLVDGNPEFYDVNKKEPIATKYNEIVEMLKSKKSIIYHAPSTKIRNKDFNTIFVENIRNENGKINKIKIHGATFNKIINGYITFDSYLGFYRNALEYVFNLMTQNVNKKVEIIDKEPTPAPKKGANIEIIPDEPNSAFNGFKKQLEAGKALNPPNLDEIFKFLKKFESNPSAIFKLFQGPGDNFGISSTLYDDMTIAERKKNFQILINTLSLKDIIAVNQRTKDLASIEENDDMATFNNDEKSKNLYQTLLSKNKKDIKKAYLKDEEIDPSLTLYDDLYYLFDRGLDDQIAKTEDDSLEGGYYFDDIENLQRKNFFDYIKTFIKPNIPSYAFRKKCMMFIDIDNTRNEIINNLLQVYDLVGQTLSSEDRLCDNQKMLEKYYNAMMKRIDNQFQSIEGYSDKIRDREFSYFPTSRLKWLLNEMNNYYLQIKNNCNSDERVRFIQQIIQYRDQLLKDYNDRVDFNDFELNYKDKNFEIIDVNKAVNDRSFDNLKTEQLEHILEIMKDYYDAKSSNNYNKYNIFKDIKPIYEQLKAAKFDINFADYGLTTFIDQKININNLLETGEIQDLSINELEKTLATIKVMQTRLK